MFQSNNINGSVFLGYEMDVRIQNIYYNLLILSLQRHCKVFVLRMDVHLPQDMNQCAIMIFNHRFIEKEKNAGYDPLYIMVRELSSEKKYIITWCSFWMGTKPTILISIFRMPESFLETSVVPMAVSTNAMTDIEMVSCWNEI